MTARIKLGQNIIELFLRPIFIIVLKNRCSILFRPWTVVHVRLFLDIGNVMPKIDWEGIHTSS